MTYQCRGKAGRLEQIQVRILKKLYAMEIIGGRHTAIENLGKGFPKHERGDVEKEVKKLVREGWLIPKPTGYGLHVSLNPRRIPELESILRESE